MVRIEKVMGTVVSIDCRDPGLDPSAIDETIRWLHEVDDRFSPFRSTSEVAAISQGVQSEAQASDEMNEVIRLCHQVRDESGGAFDAWRGHGQQRHFDPSAVVKGWSVDRAAAKLETRGARNFCINAGGDVLTRGAPEPGSKWKIGLRHPTQADKVTAVVEMADGCIATSGAYERGAHIVDANTGAAATDELLSVSVFGPTLALADAYSTAIFAMGRAGVDWMLQRAPYQAYVVTSDHHALYVPGFAALLEKPFLSAK